MFPGKLFKMCLCVCVIIHLCAHKMTKIAKCQHRTSVCLLMNQKLLQFSLLPARKLEEAFVEEKK